MGQPAARQLTALCVSRFHMLVPQASQETVPVVINKNREDIL